MTHGACFLKHDICFFFLGKFYTYSHVYDPSKANTLRLAKARTGSAADEEMAESLARLAVASDEEVAGAAARCPMLGSGLQGASVAEIREAVADNIGMLIALVACMDRD